MSKIERLLYGTCGPAVVSAIEQRLRVKTSSEQILSGLMRVTGQTIDQLADANLDLEQVLDLYKRSPEFERSPVFLAEVHLDESIIPEGTVRALLEQLVKHKGEIWVVHKNDADPHPSNPHAHNYEANLKLHLGNGDLYMGRQLTGNVGEKALKFIRSQLTKFTLPPLCPSDA